MTDGQVILQKILTDLMTILLPPVILTIMVVVTIKDKGKATMMDDEDNKLRVNWKPVCLWTCISVGMWLVLIAVAELLIHWVGR